MNQYAANKSRDATSASFVKRFAGHLSNLYEAHVARLVSLRVYPESPKAGCYPSTDSTRDVDRSVETNSRAVAASGKPWRKLAAAYAAHEARLAQLRVYGRERG